MDKIRRLTPFMSNTNSQRVPCAKCGVMILPITSQLYGGQCPKCHRETTRAPQDAVPIEVPAPTVMHIRTDESAFDRCQLHLIREIIRAIKSDLADAGVSEDRLADVTGDVAFSIAAIIDGSRVIRAEGEPVIPIITFAEDAERTKLVGRPYGSFMHEYVHSTVDEVFDDAAA
jgi:hypothetical protein